MFRLFHAKSLPITTKIIIGHLNSKVTVIFRFLNPAIAPQYSFRHFTFHSEEDMTCSLISPCSPMSPIGSLSNDDADGNENGKKAIGLISKTTTLHVHHAFLYISLPLLPNNNVKVPEFTFCRGREHKTTTFFSFC